MTSSTVWVVHNRAARAGSNGRGLAETVSSLDDRWDTVVELEAGSADDVHRHARLAVESGVDAFVVIGGDGIVHHALQSLVGTETALGVVAAGTGNDAARSLGLPLRDPRTALARLDPARRRKVDVARSSQGEGERHFITALCTGFDAAVVDRANRMRWPRGEMRYNVALLAELASFRPRHYRVTVDGAVRELEAMMVTIANGETIGGGIRVNDGGRLDDGLLEVIVIAPASRLEIVRMSPRLRDGSIVEHPAYARVQATEVRVETEGVVAYGDGERFGALPADVTCVPGALTVLAG